MDACAHLGIIKGFRTPAEGLVIELDHLLHIPRLLVSNKEPLLCIRNNGGIRVSFKRVFHQFDDLLVIPRILRQKVEIGQPP